MANVDDSLPKQRFGEWLAQTRQARGQSLDDVAAFIGVDPSAFSRWERSKSLPSVIFLDRISRWSDTPATILVALCAAPEDG